MGDQLHAPATLPLGKKPGTHFAGRWVAQGPIWKGVEKLAPWEFDPWTVQPVATCYTDRDIPAPKYLTNPLLTLSKDLFVSQLLLPHMAN